MKLEEITKVAVDVDISKYVTAVRTRSFPEYDLKAIFKEINIDQHDVMNPALRPNKRIFKSPEKPKGKNVGLQGKDNAALEPEFVREEPVNRIPLSFQKLICDKRVSFCLANPARRVYQGGTEEQINKLKKAFERVLYDNKIASHHREAAREIFTFCEVAQYWQVIDATESERYGFKTNKRIKTILYTRKDGYKFYPLKDAMGDLICFSIEWKVKEEGKIITYLQCFTDEEVIKLKLSNRNNWEVVEPVKKNTVGKIPFSFGWQIAPEYVTVSHIIARLEKILSNHGEVNDYHSAPKIFLTDADKITGVGNKGEAGIVLQGTGNADAKYLTWDHATDSVKLEVENLLMMLYTLTQTPNINFDNIKGMGAVSGVSIKLMFMDAHLAVKDKEGVLLDFFQRGNSIAMTMLGQLNAELAPIVDTIEVDNFLDPFMIADEKENAEIAQIQNGNLAVKSQETTVYEAGGDKAELTRIQTETKEREKNLLTEPTIIE